MVPGPGTPPPHFPGGRADVGFFDKFRREKRPPPYRGLGQPAPTQKIPGPGTTTPTEKISSAMTPPTEKISSATPPAAGPSDAAAEATVYMSATSEKVVAVLIGLEGVLENQVYRIFDGPNKLGRADHCEVALGSKRISREHSLLTHQGTTFRIEPLSDRNPTRVNGEATQGTELSDGDELGLGDASFRFRTVY